MAKSPKQAPRYRPNAGYTRDDWDEVSDNPELSDEELAAMRPAREVLPPELYAALVKRSRGRPRADVRKVEVKLRLDPDVVEAYRSGGPGWQTRMNEALRKGLKSTIRSSSG